MESEKRPTSPRSFAPRTRTEPRPGTPSQPMTPEPLPLEPTGAAWWDLLFIRAIFVAVMTVAAVYFHPFSLPRRIAGIVGALFAVSIILFEMRLKRASLKRLMGAAVGSILGILGAFLMSLVLSRTSLEPQTLSFVQLTLLLLMTYVGLIVGANKGDLLNLSAMGGLFGAERGPKRTYKILDTSVIIDGRIADVCETGFVDGILLIPNFVLQELQLIADSADSLKRNRGRRGLDILQRIQKLTHVQVQILEEDFPHIRDVDRKLIELGKRYEAKVVTNDFNLNKVAQLQGVEVLNINELANSLKPIVLPGETMRVFILKEGKEYNQGVAYLDDGTMVVVDNARRMISKTIDIAVTSVLQTTAGKMIFGRYEESREFRGDRQPHDSARAGYHPAGRDVSAAPAAQPAPPAPSAGQPASNSPAEDAAEPRPGRGNGVDR